MVKWIGVGLAVLLSLYFLGPIIGERLAPAPKPAPSTYVVVARKAISDGYGMVVSVLAQDISGSDIEVLVRRERKNLVQVFVYRPGQSIGRERPAELWEHTTAAGLRQLY